jgi:hypothetical protein
MTLVQEFLAGGGSTAAVSGVLNPLDVVKTRRQLPRFGGTSGVAIARAVAADHGLLALWTPGLAATLTRELVYVEESCCCAALSGAALWNPLPPHPGTRV